MSLAFPAMLSSVEALKALTGLEIWNNSNELRSVVFQRINK
jgi:hypothetical protein